MKNKPFEDYFEEINSEEKAYYLGLIVSDGAIIKDKKEYNYKNQDRLVIALQEKDGYILKNLCNSITPYKQLNKYIVGIENWSNRVIFKVSSDKLCNDLNKLGVYNKKSGSEIFPNIETNLIRHFIRGFFDGDGCCYVKHVNKSCKTGGNLHTIVSFVCLSKEFLIDLQRNLGGIGRVVERKKKLPRKVCFAYEITRKDEVRQFFEFIYNNSSIHLKRKFDKFIQGNTELTNTITSISNVETTD